MALSTAEMTRLRVMVDEPTEDTYDDAYINALADVIAKAEDASGYAPTHASYTATYDLYILASELWRQKAGAVAAEFDFESEGAAFSRSQKYEHFIAQSVRYASLSRFRSTTVEAGVTRS